jgi:hypothetical protein
LRRSSGSPQGILLQPPWHSLAPTRQRKSNAERAMFWVEAAPSFSVAW